MAIAQRYITPMRFLVSTTLLVIVVRIVHSAFRLHTIAELRENANMIYLCAHNEPTRARLSIHQDEDSRVKMSFANYTLIQNAQYIC